MQQAITSPTFDAGWNARDVLRCAPALGILLARWLDPDRPALQPALAGLVGLACLPIGFALIDERPRWATLPHALAEYVFAPAAAALGLAAVEAAERRRASPPDRTPDSSG